MILEEQNVIRGYQEVQVQTPTFSTCVLYFREVLKSSIFSQNSFWTMNHEPHDYLGLWEFESNEFIFHIIF